MGIESYEKSYHGMTYKSLKGHFEFYHNGNVIQ